MSTPLLQHLGQLLGELAPPARHAAAQAQRLTLQPGESLLREGDRWQHLWWVTRGALRLYYLDRNGQASNKNFFLEGAMFWPITPDLADHPVGFWVEALEPTEVWALPWAPWQAATTACEPWQRLERRVLAALLQDKMRREQQFLQDTATERYQTLMAVHPEWMQRLALRHLASYLGITDVALSRIRKRLK
jgi:CRP-like cAMP-binding protein